ncbi:hypothetical protein JW859_05215 [bacterium]|nr:hypothetical protein [bacterium]
MRYYLTALLLLGLALTGCPTDQPTEKAAPLERRELTTAFTRLATDAELGSSWAELGGAQSAYSVNATPAADRALVMLRGYSKPALWYTEGTFTPTFLGHESIFPDPALSRIFQIQERPEESTNQLLCYKLPKHEYVSTQNFPRGKVLGMANQPGESRSWFCVLGTNPASGQHSIEVGWFNEESLFGASLDADPAVAANGIHLAPLATGPALILAGGKVYLVKGNGQQELLDIALDSEHVNLLAADLADPAVFWVHYGPRPAAVSGDELPLTTIDGELVAFNLDGRELARLATGSAAFSQLVGDWTNRRALLAQPQTGVAAADFLTERFFWALRHGGDSSVFILPGGQVWAFANEEVLSITAQDLLDLAPQLTAGELLTRDQAELIRPVCDSLGWDWPEVQLSPLSPGDGRLCFFNTGDLAASLAEFDWDLVNERVSSLHLARRPTADDQKYLPASTDNLLPTGVTRLLAMLGWQDSAVVEASAVRRPDELYLQIELEPEARPTGTFTFWITPESTYLHLDSAGTFEPEPVEETDVCAEHMHGEGGDTAEPNADEPTEPVDENETPEAENNQEQNE